MSQNLQRPFEGYEHVASAGIWDEMPLDFDPNEFEELMTEDPEATFKLAISAIAKMHPYPYLRLLQSEGLATKDTPLHVFQPALTRVPEEPFVPLDEDTDDGLAFEAESYFVTVRETEEGTSPPSMIYDPITEGQPQEQPETQTVEALLPKTVNPIGFHTPLIEALGRLLQKSGSTWTPESLNEIAAISADCYIFRTTVPVEQISLNLGGETRIVSASALVAAGLRMAVCETIRLSRYRPFVNAVMQDPELLQELVEKEERRAAELATQAWAPQLPAAPQSQTNA